MKKELYLVIVAVLGMVGITNAQAQNPECMTNLSIYSEHVKVKNYDAAYTPWKMVYENCPALNRANFTYGERILKDKIKNSSGAEKDGYIQDLLSLQGQMNLGSGRYEDDIRETVTVLQDVGTVVQLFLGFSGVEDRQFLAA